VLIVDECTEYLQKPKRINKKKILTIEEIRTKLNFVSPEEYKKDWLKRIKPLLDEEKKQVGYVDYERRTGRTTELMLKALAASQMYNIVIFAKNKNYATDLKKEIEKYAQHLNITTQKIVIGYKDIGYTDDWFKFYDHTYTSEFYHQDEN
jgi:hypothetical protein